MLEEAGVGGLDGVMLDFGVSSFQLDEASRGFSYLKDAPLDMRMDARNGLTAADVVNGYSAERLEKLLREYGEERFAKRIAGRSQSGDGKAASNGRGNLHRSLRTASLQNSGRTGRAPAKPSRRSASK